MNFDQWFFGEYGGVIGNLSKESDASWAAWSYQQDVIDQKDKEIGKLKKNNRELDLIRAKYKITLIDAITTMSIISGDENGYGNPDDAVDFLERHEKIVLRLKES
jgi:hypothetical protein